MIKLNFYKDGKLLTERNNLERRRFNDTKVFENKPEYLKFMKEESRFLYHNEKVEIVEVGDAP